MRTPILAALVVMTVFFFVPPAFAAQLDAAIIHDEDTRAII